MEAVIFGNGSLSHQHQYNQTSIKKVRSSLNTNIGKIKMYFSFSEEFIASYEITDPCVRMS